jgi:hypothetical protein
MKMAIEASEFDLIECDSAEMALATMLLRGHELAMIFADIRPSGEMDGMDLAREVKIRWPHLVVISPSGKAASTPGRIRSIGELDDLITYVKGIAASAPPAANMPLPLTVICKKRHDQSQ